MSGTWRLLRRQKDRTPDRAELAQLLDSIQQLRLTLTADLAAAASAVEADHPEIARDIIAADRVEVRRLSTSVVAPRRPEPPRRRRRALLALPAIPLVGALAMTGAAAIGGHNGTSTSTYHRSSTTPSARQTPGEISETAATTLRHLARVVQGNSHPSQVVAVADHLHSQLSALLATSPRSAARIGEVQHLLSVEQRLLERHRGPGAAIALAASRKLTRLLHVTALPTAAPTPVLPVLILPSATAKPTPTPTSTPTSKPTPKVKKSPPSAATPTPKPSHSRSGRHHHHHHTTNPLLGPVLFTGHLFGR
jgi:hypothetical protein